MTTQQKLTLAYRRAVRHGHVVST